MSSGIRIDPSNMIRKSAAEIERKSYALEVLGRVAAARMENEAKAEPPAGHPWQNRTYMAERSIAGRVDRRGDITRISLSGGVRYMVYLELAMGKRFAILWPTIKRNANEILKAVARLGGGGNGAN